ncbi:MAG: orotate phosphoribosyltransferase [Chloroflexi bacterium]|nr:orotate phosphoribosyltransferase [Chloroflexota bacterium]
MKQSVAKALLDIGAVGFSPKAPIIFKSGIRSPVYVDNRILIYHPKPWHLVIESFKTLIETQELKRDVIAGVAVGGVPHSAALAYVTGVPSVFIRKESKGHGKAQRIEGGEVQSRHALLVEDLVTTGGSSLSAVDALIAAGAKVTDVLAIIGYGFDEASAAFDRAGLRLHTLTDFATILDQARQTGRLDDGQIAIIKRWFDNPYSWNSEST